MVPVERIELPTFALESALVAAVGIEPTRALPEAF